LVFVDGDQIDWEIVGLKDKGCAVVTFEAGKRIMRALQRFGATQRLRRSWPLGLFDWLDASRQPNTHLCPTIMGTHQLNISPMRSSQLSRNAQAQPLSWHAFVPAHPVKARE